MNKTQKAAIYGLYLVGFMLLIPLVDLVDTKVNPVLLRVIAYPLVIVMILPIWFLTRKRNQAEVQMDERDKAIVKRSLLIACGAVGVGLLIIYTAVIFAGGRDEIVKVSTLPVVVFFSFIAFLLILSSAVLVQYKLGGKQNE